MNAKMNEHSPYPQGNHCPLEKHFQQIRGIGENKGDSIPKQFFFSFCGE